MLARTAGFVCLLAFAAWGCTPPSGTASLQQVNDEMHRQVEPAQPAAKTLADVDRLGLKTPSGTILDESPTSSTVTELSYKRTYYVKLYVDGDVAKTTGFFMDSLKDPHFTGGADAAKIDGKTDKGFDVEVMLGPAADHKKTVALAWITQQK
ncbi:MAG: hypothetical protein JSS66_01425 [Armatimonadetes bacterium]|nr:hypothetical protein [Armatimonadota bacterium]